MLEKTCSVCPPNSSSNVALTVAHGTGAVLSRHFWNSRTYSSGKRVGEEAINWPSLMYVAPSFSKSDLKTTCRMYTLRHKVSVQRLVDGVSRGSNVH